jgi:hypothetical protein
MDNTIDPNIKNLVSAIGKAETGKSSPEAYSQKGASGEFGRYQFMPDTWKQWAPESGVDVNDMSIEAQNKVAYNKIKSWKEQGLNPAQIASKWNSGNENAYKENHKGVNKFGVAYDTPAYTEKVSKYYQEGKGAQGGYNPKPFSTGAGMIDYSGNAPTTETPTANKDTLGGQLLGRTEDIGTAIKDTMSGKQNIVSGILQTAGGVAGGIGDVAGKALELIPGVKWLEEQIGTGVGKLAQTEAGQSVAKSIQKFSTEHPELSKDIGAGFNIITAIPILKGLGTIGTLAKDVTAQSLKGIARKSFVTGGPEIIGKTKAAQRLLAKNPNVFGDMVDRGLIGDIKGNNYITIDDINKSWKTIKNNNAQVKKIISDPKFATVGEDGNKIAMDALKNSPQSGMVPSEMIANARKLDGSNKLLWDKFEAGQANLAEINELRSSLDGKVKKAFIQGASLDTPEIALSKELGADLSNSMRSFVQGVAPETQPYFKEMATQFDIQKALELMNNKAIKPGTVAGVTGDIIGTGVGGTIGATIGGTPGAVIGGLAGQRTGGTIARKLAGQNITQGILKRTGKNAVKTSKKAAIKSVGGLIGGVNAQKLNP